MDTQQLMNAVMDKVKPGKENEATNLLNDVTKEIKGGTFGADDIARYAPKLMGIVKPEYIADVQSQISKFVATHKQ